jgi:soluble lytic murein transglycosylase-like protein
MPVLTNGRGRIAAVSAVVTVVTLVAVAAIVGWGESRSSRTADPGRWVAAVDAPSPSPSDPPSPSLSPSPSPSPPPSPSPTRKAATPTKKATTKPVPSHAPVAVPPPAPPPADTCARTYSGTAASYAAVGAALDAAAGATYHPYIKDVAGHEITVSATLLKAVAWQESGWQSNVVSCYGAFGTMQVIKNTADWMNGNYGTSYDLHALPDNTALGAEYLAWLVYYFGHFCFNDDYDITHLDPDHPDLRDAVLAAYNLGIGKVDTPDGLVIPNRGYTNAVEGLMSSQPWKSATGTPSP